MIRHDDEAIEEERVEILYTVQCFNGFSGRTGIDEDWRAISRVRCNEHDSIVLNRVVPDCTHEWMVRFFFSARQECLASSTIHDHEGNMHGIPFLEKGWIPNACDASG